MSKRHESQPGVMAEEENRKTTEVEQVVVSCERLNLRKAASPDAQVLYILTRGDVLDVLENRVDWIKVRFTKLALDGYVMAKFVTNV